MSETVYEVLCEHYSNTYNRREGISSTNTLFLITEDKSEAFNYFDNCRARDYDNRLDRWYMLKVEDGIAKPLVLCNCCRKDITNLPKRTVGTLGRIICDNDTCLEEWLGETKYELYMEDESE